MENNGKTFMPMSIDTVVDMFGNNLFLFRRMIIRDRFAINLDMEKNKATPMMINMLHSPFLITDNRILRVLSGMARIEINLKEHNIGEGDILLIKENTYWEIKELSDDARAELIVFTPDKYPTNLPYCAEGATIIHPVKEEWNRISGLIYTMYSFAQAEPYRKDVVEPLATALINTIASLSGQDGTKGVASGMEYLFSRFMDELNRSGTGKLPVSYYAGKLCVSPQYLSKSVSRTSGKTVSQWINKAVITKAKVLLGDRSRSISDISDALNFPNDSFFCRFFKRETGLTPTQYRKGKIN